MGKVSKGKQTKAFLKKGLLDGQIKKRHEVRAFKQKVKGRAVQRNKAGNGHGKPKEDEHDSEDDAPAGKDDDSDEDDLDVDAVLGAEGVDEDVSLRVCC
jgi:nucleolar complex protein 2